ncbi:MAG: hypothetical protein M1444_01775 [Patescibacteria group bacterium]|nr:hypothetical protein [Patescibacteria group bacterium]
MAKVEIITRTPEMHPNPAIQELIDKRDEYVNTARKVSRIQVELWRQIPWLALQADGRSGYYAKFTAAYEQGYWVLDEGEFSSIGTPSNTGVCVDLETGELVDTYTATNEDWGNNPVQPASDEGILKVLAVPEQLDAATLLAWLKSDAKRPTSKSYDARKQEDWRKRKIDELKLTPIYSRGKKVVSPNQTTLIEAEA